MCLEDMMILRSLKVERIELASGQNVILEPDKTRLGITIASADSGFAVVESQLNDGTWGRIATRSSNTVAYSLDIYQLGAVVTDERLRLRSTSGSQQFFVTTWPVSPAGVNSEVWANAIASFLSKHKLPGVK